MTNKKLVTKVKRNGNKYSLRIIATTFCYLFFVICIGCDLFNASLDPDYWQKIDTEIAYANAPIVNVQITTGNMGTAFTSGSRQVKLWQEDFSKYGYEPFTINYQPFSQYPFTGWQAWVEGEPTWARWELQEWQNDKEYYVGSGVKVKFVPKNDDGTVVDIFVYDMPPEGETLYIGPMGADTAGLNVSVEPGGLGTAFPSGGLSGIIQGYPFNISFQPSADYPFRGWQAVFGENLSVWKSGEENEADEYILWQPRNASGTEMTITILNLGETSSTGQITIMPIDGDNNSITVVASVPGSWGTVFPSTAMYRRQGFPFTISYNPSGNYEFRGWEISVNSEKIVWELGDGEVVRDGISWSPRNASGTEMELTVTMADVDLLTIRPVGSNNSELAVTINGMGLGTVSSTVSQAVPAVLEFPFNVSIQPDAAYTFRGWQAAYQVAGSSEQVIVSRWETGSGGQTDNGVVWNPRSASGTEMSVTVTTLPDGFFLATGTITVMPLGGDSPTLNVSVQSGELGITSPAGTPSPAVRQGFPFNVSFQASAGFEFRGWQAIFQVTGSSEQVAVSRWEVGGGGDTDNGVVWSPRNASGSEMSITIETLPENFLPTSQITIMPLDGDSKSITVVVFVPGSWGTGAGSSPSRRQGFPFTISFNPSGNYEFRGWEAVYQVAGSSEQVAVKSEWYPGDGNDAKGLNGIVWYPRNASGTEMDITITTSGTETLTIRPIGSNNPILNVSVNSGNLGTVSSTISPAVPVYQGFPFNVSFQPDAAYPFRGWQLAANSEKIVWELGEGAIERGGIIWSPRNASGTEMSVTLPDGFDLQTGTVTIMPIGGDSGSINVVVNVPASWGTGSGSASRRQGFPFTISFNPSGNYAFQGWEAVYQVADNNVRSEWKFGVGVDGSDGIIWYPRNASGTEMDVTITAFDVENLTIRPIGSNNPILNVSVNSGNLGTVSSTVSSAVPAVQGFPFNVSFQPDAAYPFGGWQAMIGEEVISHWNSGVPVGTPTGNVTWSPRNASGTEMSVTITSDISEQITIMPLGGESASIEVRVLANPAWGTNLSAQLLNRRVGFPFTVEFSASGAWDFLGWKAYAYNEQTVDDLDPDTLGQELPLQEVNIEVIGIGRAVVTVNTDTQVLLVPLCVTPVRVQHSNPPHQSPTAYAPGQVITITFSTQLDPDPDMVKFGEGFIQITGQSSGAEPVDITTRYNPPVYNDEMRTITITPKAGELLTADTFVSVTVGTEVKGRFGNRLSSPAHINFNVSIESGAVVRSAYTAYNVWALHDPVQYEQEFFQQWSNYDRDRRIRKNADSKYEVTLYFGVQAEGDIENDIEHDIEIVEIHYAHLSGNDVSDALGEVVSVGKGTFEISDNDETSGAGQAYKTANPNAGKYYKAVYTWDNPVQGIIRLAVLPSGEEAAAEDWRTVVAESRGFITVVHDNLAPGGAETAVFGGEATQSPDGAGTVYNYNSSASTMTVNLNFRNIRDNFDQGLINGNLNASGGKPRTMDPQSAIEWQWRIVTGADQNHPANNETWLPLLDNQGESVYVISEDLSTKLTSDIAVRGVQLRYRDALGLTSEWKSIGRIRYYNSARGVQAIHGTTATSTEDFIYQNAPLERDRRLRGTTVNASVTLYFYMPAGTTAPTSLEVAEIHYASLQGNDINTEVRTRSITLSPAGTTGADGLYRTSVGNPAGASYYKAVYTWTSALPASPGIIRLAVMPFSGTNADTWQNAVIDGRFVTVVMDNQSPGGSHIFSLSGEEMRDGTVYIYNASHPSLTISANLSGITDNAGLGIPLAGATYDKPWTMDGQAVLQWRWRIVRGTSPDFTGTWTALSTSQQMQTLSLDSDTANRNIEVQYCDSMGNESAWLPTGQQIRYFTDINAVSSWSVECNASGNTVTVRWTRPTNMTGVEVLVDGEFKERIHALDGSYTFTVPEYVTTGIRRGEMMQATAYSISLMASSSNGNAAPVEFKIWNIPGMRNGTADGFTELIELTQASFDSSPPAGTLVLSADSRTYVLTQDVEIASHTPIGGDGQDTNPPPFTGTLYGNGYTVTINSFGELTGVTNIGLFSMASGTATNPAIIRDLILEYDASAAIGINATAVTSIGGIVGSVSGTGNFLQILNCIVRGAGETSVLSVEGTGGAEIIRIGGIAGYFGGRGKIGNCLAALSVEYKATGASPHTGEALVGGIAGQIGWGHGESFSINNGYTGGTSNQGPTASLSGLLIDGVSVTANVSANKGGAAGVLALGGAVGRSQGDDNENTNTGGRNTVRGIEFPSGKVSFNRTQSDFNYVGGIIGDAERTNVAECSFMGSIEVIGQTNPPSVAVPGETRLGGLIGHNNARYSGNHIKIHKCNVSGNIEFMGSSTKYVGGLLGYSNSWGASNPSITITNSFFEGNISVSGSESSSAAGFGGRFINRHHIYNCGSLEGTITVNTSGTINAGGFSTNFEGSLSNCFSKMNIITTATGTTWAGGLLSQFSGTDSITACYATGTIDVSGTSMYIGGLVGLFSGTGTIKDSYALGNVLGESGNSFVNAGGLVGAIRSTEGSHTVGCTIRESFSAGRVSARSASAVYAGGIVGYRNNFDVGLVADQQPDFVSNNAVLGASVSALGGTSTTNRRVGRIYGRTSSVTNCSNNYALATMVIAEDTSPTTLNPATRPADADTVDTRDGRNVAAGSFFNPTLWTGTGSLGFTTTNWDFSGVAREGFPRLRNVDGQ